MYHSIFISGKNTYTEWGMVPTSRPVVNPPEIKSTQISLPASDGVLDYTELLLGGTPYGQRTGSWEFVLKPGKNWAGVYADILNYIHGQVHTVILEDEPNIQYTGRLTVNTWQSEPEHSLLTIDYNLDPFRQTVTSTETSDWLWNDLFDTSIRYGTFTVRGTKYRNLINAGYQPTVPVFTCTAPMTVTFGGEIFNLLAGRNYNRNLTLQPGDNIMLFSGNGNVNVNYREVYL